MPGLRGDRTVYPDRHRSRYPLRRVSRQAHRQAGTEQHHPAGQHNLPVTVPIPINEHRILSDRQRDWPNETLKNPDKNPVLKAAGALRGWIDALTLIIERCIGWIPAMLEDLNEWLTTRIGPRWWEEWGWRGAA